MNQRINPTSIALRAVFAAASAITTLCVVAAMGALAAHYAGSAQPGQIVTVSKR